MPKNGPNARKLTFYMVVALPGGINSVRDKLQPGKILPGKILSPALKRGEKPCPRGPEKMREKCCPGLGNCTVNMARSAEDFFFASQNEKILLSP